jgi:hypothetical protein
MCSIEIVKDGRCYVQVLKLWYLVPLEDITKLATHVDNELRRYTDEYIVCCKEKGFDGMVEFPLSWPRSANIQKLKSVGTTNITKGDLVASKGENNAAENSMIAESTLLMKFCAISPDYTRTGCHDIEVDLPF